MTWMDYLMAGVITALVTMFIAGLSDEDCGPGVLFVIIIVSVILPPLSWAFSLFSIGQAISSKMGGTSEHEATILTNLYARYLAICAEMEVTAQPRHADWPEHWDLVLRLKDASK